MYVVEVIHDGEPTRKQSLKSKIIRDYCVDLRYCRIVPALHSPLHSL